MDVPRLRRLLAAGAAAAGAVVAASALFPRSVYDRFLWRYFVGPVMADAAGRASLTVRGVTAHSGYTLVSEVGYGLLLVYAVLVLVSVLRRLDMGEEDGFVLWFVPFVVAGGLLRVVEDAASAGVIALPDAVRVLLVSPVIYLTMFVGVMGALLVGGWLARRGRVPHPGVVVGGAGAVAAAGLLGLLAVAVPVANWWVAGVTLTVAGGLLAAAGAGIRLAGLPLAAAVSGRAGIAILGGHLVDGAATAVTFELVNPAVAGVGRFTFAAANAAVAAGGYGEKHPVVAGLIGAAGSAWVFVLVKLAVVGGIVYYVGAAEEADAPRLHNLLLVGLLALGLGPGTRTMMRAVFGV